MNTNEHPLLDIEVADVWFNESQAKRIKQAILYALKPIEANCDIDTLPPEMKRWVLTSVSRLIELTIAVGQHTISNTWGLVYDSKQAAYLLHHMRNAVLPLSMGPQVCDVPKDASRWILATVARMGTAIHDVVESTREGQSSGSPMLPVR